MGKTIRDLNDVAPLSGTELVEAAQKGKSVKIQLDEISDFVSMPISAAALERDNRIYEYIDANSVSAAVLERDNRIYEYIDAIPAPTGIDIIQPGGDADGLLFPTNFILRQKGNEAGDVDYGLLLTNKNNGDVVKVQMEIMDGVFPPPTGMFRKISNVDPDTLTETGEWGYSFTPNFNAIEAPSTPTFFGQTFVANLSFNYSVTQVGYRNEYDEFTEIYQGVPLEYYKAYGGIFSILATGSFPCSASFDPTLETQQIMGDQGKVTPDGCLHVFKISNEGTQPISIILKSGYTWDGTNKVATFAAGAGGSLVFVPIANTNGQIVLFSYQGATFSATIPE